ncbi:MAG: hypothetical protein KatS3mg129_0399 [Leptospiraceae bacterium]|nr:MAG: hypothetical protein KatS3mg129_0399 [Leptospiraceae bacterium]
MPEPYEYKEKESLYSKFIKLLLKILNKKDAFEKTIHYYYKTNQIQKDIFQFPQPPYFLFRKNYQKIQFKKRNIYIFNPDKDIKQTKIILYFHGGAFLRNFYLFHWHFIRKILQYSPYSIYAVDYPLIPENNYKNILYFCFDLYLFLRKKHNIILMGDSAGGNLCLAILQKIQKHQNPDKMILLSPWLNLTMNHSLIPDIEKYDLILNRMGLKLAGEIYSNNSSDLPEVSPIYYNYTNLPETHIFTGTHDILYPDIEDFYKKNKNIYLYVFPKMVHDWMILDLFDSSLFSFKEAKKVDSILKNILNDSYKNL